MQSSINYDFKPHHIKPLSALLIAALTLGGCGAGNSSTSSSSSSTSSSSSSSSSSSTSSTSSSSSSSSGISEEAAFVYAINAGGSSVTLGGIEYSADRFSNGGTSGQTQDPIANTTLDTLYQSERWGSFAYEIPVTAASYSIKLHFVEMFHESEGSRYFSVAAEGMQLFSDMDLVAEAGHDSAFTVVQNDIPVSDGHLTIELSASVDNGTISAIEIFSNNGGEFVVPLEPVCNESERQQPRVVNYDSEFSDPQYFDSNVARPPNGPRGFVIEHARQTLQYHTIYRPQTLMESDSLPIVAWGNGACSNEGLSQADFLSEIASHGYLVIANGAPGGGGNNDGHETELLKAIDWAIAENNRECSQFYGKLNVDKIATMGWSCGGAMAHYAAVDPRVDTAAALNSGLFSQDRFDYYPRFHSPIAILNGNSSDVAYSNGLRSYDEITNVPVYHSNHANLGHGDAYFQNNGGDMGRAAVGWLNWHLKGDTSATGRGLFLDNNCFMCRSPWTSKNKGF